MGLFDRDPLSPTLGERFSMAAGGLFDFLESARVGTVAKVAAVGASAVFLVPPAYNYMVTDDRPIEETAITQTADSKGFAEGKAAIERMAGLKAEYLRRSLDPKVDPQKAETRDERKAREAADAEYNRAIDQQKRVLFSSMLLAPDVSEKQMTELQEMYLQKANFGWVLKTRDGEVIINEGKGTAKPFHRDHVAWRNECQTIYKVDVAKELSHNIDGMASCLRVEAKDLDMKQFFGGAAAIGGGLAPGLIAGSLAASMLGGAAGWGRRRRDEIKSRAKISN